MVERLVVIGFGLKLRNWSCEVKAYLATGAIRLRAYDVTCKERLYGVCSMGNL